MTCDNNLVFTLLFCILFKPLILYKMKNKIEINGHNLIRRQVGATEFKILVYRNDKIDFRFNVLLLPSGEDNLLPTYQLFNNFKTVPFWINENINKISNWISKEMK